jgi:site-specific recombinase XerD
MLGLPEILAAAGIRPIARPWHTLRHTMASHYMMAGGSLLALSKILGHSDIKVTMIYAHLSPDFMAAEMDRLKF